MHGTCTCLRRRRGRTLETDATAFLIQRCLKAMPRLLSCPVLILRTAIRHCGLTLSITFAVWPRDGRLVSGGDAGLRVWDLTSGTSRLLRTCRKTAPDAFLLLASPDSRLVLRLDPADQTGLASSDNRRPENSPAEESLHQARSGPDPSAPKDRHHEIDSVSNPYPPVAGGRNTERTPLLMSASGAE